MSEIVKKSHNFATIKFADFSSVISSP